jgi:hypothetical protein
MPCVPAPLSRVARKSDADAFAFSPSQDAMGRTIENTAVMFSAPWRAYWALTLEALDIRNYRV